MAPVLPGATVAVTGASGFIGSHVCAALLSAGYRVRAVVRDPTDASKVQHLQALSGAAERLTLCSGLLDRPGSYDEALAGADAVIHSAAVVELNDVKDPENQIIKPSIEGAKNVLESAVKAKTVKRFVHTSSEIAALKWDEPLDATFTEESWNTVSTVATGDPYGYAKSTAERLVLSHSSDVFDCVSILPGVNLGPCLTKAHTKSSAVVVRQILFGNRQPDYHCHFVDVRDTAMAHVKALALQLAPDDSRRFLVVSDHQMRVLSLEEPLRRLFPEYAMDAKPLLMQALVTTPLLWRLVASLFQHVFSTHTFTIDNRKSKEVLGLQYRPLDETLKDTVTSMVDPGWCAPRRL